MGREHQRFGGRLVFQVITYGIDELGKRQILTNNVLCKVGLQAAACIRCEMGVP